MPKIHFAQDTLDDDDALNLAQLAASYVDILEARTPLIKSVGISIGTKHKAAHSEKTVLQI